MVRISVVDDTVRSELNFFGASQDFYGATWNYGTSGGRGGIQTLFDLLYHHQRPLEKPQDS